MILPGDPFLGFCYVYWPAEGTFTNNAQRNVCSENQKMGKVTFLSQPLIVLLTSLWPYLHLGRVYIISFTKNYSVKSKMQIHTIPVSLTFNGRTLLYPMCHFGWGRIFQCRWSRVTGCFQRMIHWILCNRKGLSVLHSHPMMRPA